MSPRDRGSEKPGSPAGRDAAAPGEFELIERIHALLPPHGPDLVVGPGDDCAVVDLGAERLVLLTCDALVEGRHFRRSHGTPEELGARLAAVNLSDIAAMGGQARYALLSLVLPPDDAEAWGPAVARGVAAALAAAGATLAGGNLAATSGPLVLDLALVGEVERERCLRRSGSRPGDMLCVTGDLGASAAGLALLDHSAGGDFDALIRRHLQPTARLAEGRVLSASPAVRAAIDLSDGLASDLVHLCEASGVGADVRLGDLPVSEATRAAAHALGLDALSLATSGGEDYELLFTVSAEHVKEIVSAVERGTRTVVTPIGTIRGERGVAWIDAHGRESDPPRLGWDHFRPRR